MFGNIKLGLRLESELIEYLCFQYKDGYVSSTDEQDALQGTDGFLWGMPFDLTCNFENKDHMVRLEERVNLVNGADVIFGIRTGNSHKEFETPVLVIGISTPSITSIGAWWNNLMDAFLQKIDAICDKAQDLYWAYIDRMEEAAEGLC